MTWHCIVHYAYCIRGNVVSLWRSLGVRKIITSPYHPSGNGGVERVNHTMAQMLAMVVNELQNNWDEQLPHVEFAYNNSVSAATGLAPNGYIRVGCHASPSRFSSVLESPTTGA